MLKVFAKIEGGLVINLGVAEDVWPFEDDPYIEVPSDEAQVSVGWGFTDGKFMDITQPEPTQNSANQPTSIGLQTL